MQPLFDLLKLKVSSQKKTLLDIDALALPKGEIIAIIGANGAGKSTFLQCLLGEVVGCHCTGTVLCEGAPIRQVVRKGKIALVGQHEVFSMPLTVLEYALLGVSPKLSWYKAPSQADRLFACAYLERFELNHLMDKRVMTLSGGERQRLALVRALMQKTDILLLDEPTNHLDIRHQKLLFEVLAELNKTGKSLVLVLHNLAYAYTHASYTIALKDGKVLAHGTKEQVMCDELLQTMYQTNIRRYHTEGGVVFL